MTIQDKRAYLKELSNQAAEIKEELLHKCKNDAEIQAINAMSVNDIIVNYIHKKGEHTEFKSYKQWQEEGKQVKRGETAFLVWGRPKAVQDEETGKQTDEDEETFFPVSFIFSNAQVRTAKND